MFKPMLAGEAPAQIKFPVMASPKLDGIRCIVINGVAMSRSFKPIPNAHVQKMLAQGFDGFDGELIVGSPGAPDAYRKTNSAVMSRDGTPDFTYFIFDNIYSKGGYSKRYHGLVDIAHTIPDPGQLLIHVDITNDTELDQYESDQLAAGLEGIILRSVDGPYKNGRSSSKEGYLLKLKRFSDSEAVIEDVQELCSNQNVATKDAFGHTERSSHKENMVPQGTLGALLVRDIKSKVEFKIGTGFDAKLRQDLWDQRNSLKGKIVKYKFFDGGIKVAPRFPVFIGFRDEIDM